MCMFSCFSWHLQFLRSEFKGQLPKPYSSEPLATRIIPKDMNDMNKEEMSRYVSQSICQIKKNKCFSGNRSESFR